MITSTKNTHTHTIHANFRISVVPANTVANESQHPSSSRKCFFKTGCFEKKKKTHEMFIYERMKITSSQFWIHPSTIDASSPLAKAPPLILLHSACSTTPTRPEKPCGEAKRNYQRDPGKPTGRLGLVEDDENVPKGAYFRGVSC